MKPTFPERLTAASPVFREIPLTRGSVAPTPGAFDLPHGALWSIEPQRGLTIHCAQGELWITQAGDDRDTILSAGDAFAPRPKGRIVIQALSEARVVLAI